MAQVEINEIDLSRVDDGIYYEYTDAGPIIAEQSVLVDTISGATLSSTVILDTIETALM